MASRWPDFGVHLTIQVQEQAAHIPDSEETVLGTAEFLQFGDIHQALRLHSGLILNKGDIYNWMGFAERLAKEAPEEGFRWLSGLPFTDQTQLAMLVFSSALHERDPELGMKLLEKALSLGFALSKDYCSGLLKIEAGRSMESAFEIIERAASTQEHRDDLVRGLASRLNGGKRHDLVVKIAERFPYQTGAANFGESLYSLWKDHPAEAQRRLDGLDEKFVAQTCNTLARLYGRESPELAAQWVGSLPPGEARDRAAAGLGIALSHTQPLESVQWSVTIENETTRSGAMSTLLGVGIQRDLEATREIVKKAGLSDAETAKWLRFIEKITPSWLPEKGS